MFRVCCTNHACVTHVLYSTCSVDSRVSYRISKCGGGACEVRRRLGGLGACPPPPEFLGKLGTLMLILVGFGVAFGVKIGLVGLYVHECS